MKSQVNLIIDEDNWLENNQIAFWQENFDNILEKIVSINNNKKSEVNLLLTNSENIAQLNKEFRGKNAPTNVLSFPHFENSCNIDTACSDKIIFIGDIAMSFEIIMRESDEFKVDFTNRCFHLFVHGVLHLLGFDHQNEEQENKMEELEIDILSSFGIKNPYIL